MNRSADAGSVTREECMCGLCAAPLPLQTFPGAIPERQRVFTVRDGARIHIPPCPANTDDEVPADALRMPLTTDEE